MPDKSAVERRLAQAVGQRLRSLRQDLGLSQEQFAHRAGISRNQYQLLEAGLSDRADRRLVNPRLSTLVGIARVHGLSTSELVAQILGEVPIERNGAPANLAETTPGDHGHARDAEGTATPRHRRRSAT